MRSKKVIISVTTDLVTDQRVQRIASSLQRHGLDVTLIGRKRKASLSFDMRPYKVVRMKLWWETGPFFLRQLQLAPVLLPPVSQS